MDHQKDLIIWLPSGQTMKFENVREDGIADGYLTFKYDGVSTSTTRYAEFALDKIMGWAIKAHS